MIDIYFSPAARRINSATFCGCEISYSAPGSVGPDFQPFLQPVLQFKFRYQRYNLYISKVICAIISVIYYSRAEGYQEKLLSIFKLKSYM